MRTSSKTSNILNYAILVYLFQVNGSLLSRLKNQYEYLPLTTNNITVQDVEYGFAAENTIPTAAYENAREVSHPSPQFGEALSSLRMISAINSPTYYDKYMSIRNQTNFDKRTKHSNLELNYYDGDRRPTVELFVARTSSRVQQTASTTGFTNRNKRTWPAHFPPKFVSKLQAELDDAILPWKMKKLAPTTKSLNVSTNLSAYVPTEPSMRSHGIQASCYMCGLDQHGIPVMPGCYDAFESDDLRQRKLKRHFKVKCIQDNNVRRIKNKLYGPEYIGGCFKRFLDIGIEYNERGCRTKEPIVGKSYASRRLARLERMLKDTDDGCVFSPYASLTPFNRAISLYARYHVCVCSSRYCNQASNLLQSNLNKLVWLVLLVN